MTTLTHAHQVLYLPRWPLEPPSLLKQLLGLAKQILYVRSFPDFERFPCVLPMLFKETPTPRLQGSPVAMHQIRQGPVRSFQHTMWWCTLFLFHCDVCEFWTGVFESVIHVILILACQLAMISQKLISGWVHAQVNVNASHVTSDCIEMGKVTSCLFD